MLGRATFAVLSRRFHQLFLVAVLAGATFLSSAATVEELLADAIKFEDGATRPEDAAAVARAYEIAALAGSGHAWLRLGLLYETGTGVAQSYVQARKCYESAIAAGVPEAHLRLSICHLEGWGGPVDRAAFAREVRHAADGGYAPAKRVLSALYASGVGVPRDLSESTKWMESAALNDDDPVAQHAIGLYAQLLGSRFAEKDDDLARTWYQLSAASDYSEGLRAMARSLLLRSNPTARNFAVGRDWLKLAAEGGDFQAEYALAIVDVMHVDSKQPNLEESRARLIKAAAAGHGPAREILELEAGGLPMAEAMSYVLRTPSAERIEDKAAGILSTESTTVSREPVLFHRVPASYPESLRLLEVEGTATIEFVVNEHGKVEAPRIAEASHPLFGEGAKEAISQWEFHPAKKNGISVRRKFIQKVTFTLANEPSLEIDGLLAVCRQLAEAKGPDVAADATDLRIARPLAPLPFGVMPDGSPPPAGSFAALLLVLDEKGFILRGHVLEERPANLGVSLLAQVKLLPFEPRVGKSGPEPSNVILSYKSNDRGPVFRQP